MSQKVIVVPLPVSWAMANAASESTHIQSALNASTTERRRAPVSGTGSKPSGAERLDVPAERGVR